MSLTHIENTLSANIRQPIWESLIIRSLSMKQLMQRFDALPDHQLPTEHSKVVDYLEQETPQLKSLADRLSDFAIKFRQVLPILRSYYDSKTTSEPFSDRENKVVFPILSGVEELLNIISRIIDDLGKQTDESKWREKFALDLYDLWRFWSIGEGFNTLIKLVENGDFHKLMTGDDGQFLMSYGYQNLNEEQSTLCSATLSLGLSIINDKVVRGLADYDCTKLSNYTKEIAPIVVNKT